MKEKDRAKDAVGLRIAREALMRRIAQQMLATSDCVSRATEMRPEDA